MNISADLEAFLDREMYYARENGWLDQTMLNRMIMEATESYFKVPSIHLAEGTKKNHAKQLEFQLIMILPVLPLNLTCLVSGRLILHSLFRK
jgi:hypothetical protein